MLSKPKAGWTTFELCDDYSYRLSYLTDVCIDWLDAAIRGLDDMKPFAVHGFCEPDRMVCLVSFDGTYIVYESDACMKNSGYKHMYGVDVTMIDFCRNLHRDISENLEEWVNWNNEYLYDDERDEEEMKPIRRSKIKEKLDRLEELIKAKEGEWEHTHLFF